MIGFHLVSQRIGVMAMVVARRRSVQMPVSLVIVSIGLTPRSPQNALYTSQRNGPSAATNTTGFKTRPTNCP